MSAGVFIQLDLFVSNSPSFCSSKYCFLSQEFNTHGRGHADSATFGLVFFPRLQRLIVVAKAYAVTGRLRRTIEKNVFARLLILTHHIRFTAGSFHLIE